MSKFKLQPMKEVKIFVQGEQLNHVTNLLDAVKTPGYTIVPTISDKGNHGVHVSNPMTNELENTVMLLTVVPEEQLEPIIAGIAPIFEKHAGAIFVFDTTVVKRDSGK
ncbi:MAG: P-II family nitrogen regulator [Deltaproteobacteria bacterium]|nr:P-II family nitrogen regulator [Deltaproteobacteria bacterium]